MNVLFVCNQNKNRSKTAELLYKKTYDVKSAGLYNEHPITQKSFAWADTVIVMEEEQRIELAKRFPDIYLKKRILSLDIPDIFCFNQPELINRLKEKMHKLSIADLS